MHLKSALHLTGARRPRYTHATRVPGDMYDVRGEGVPLIIGPVEFPTVHPVIQWSINIQQHLQSSAERMTSFCVFVDQPPGAQISLDLMLALVEGLQHYSHFIPINLFASSFGLGATKSPKWDEASLFPASVASRLKTCPFLLHPWPNNSGSLPETPPLQPSRLCATSGWIGHGQAIWLMAPWSCGWLQALGGVVS
jgi:hypothetical protein